MKHPLATALAAIIGLAASLHAQPADIPTTYAYSHDIAPRLQWNANWGYCGETSLISAGMHFGQYCSQFTARRLASPGIPQSNQDSQLLLGVNDIPAARKMRLQATEYYNITQESTKEFLAWVKSQTLAGRVVILGVFNNGILLDEWTGRKDGDEEYDHIAPVLKWGSNYSLSDYDYLYIASDVITISDNGLYGPFGNPPAYQFLYSYQLRGFQGTRTKANNPRGPVYLLKNKPNNYAIAIEGPIDLEGQTIPVRLTSNVNYEPAIAEGSDTPPTPIPIKLTATVSIPNPMLSYRLYRYDNFESVPAANFDSEPQKAAQYWNIPIGVGSTFSVTIDTMSDQTHVFRAVRHDNLFPN